MRNYEVDPLRIAMLGMIPENNHPYSWSAIINGYDVDRMANCPAPVIPQYLGRQPKGSVGIPFARVTHIWTDDPASAPSVSAATYIPNVVQKPADVIGEVDAVIISTDDGDDHLRRAEPFIAAGLPIFIDKPLATNERDLAKFVSYRRQGAVIVSSSGLRYAPECEALRGKTWRWITGSTCKSWLRYGIHVLEPIYTVTGPGYVRVRADARGGNTWVQAEHANGTIVSIAALEEGFGSAFVLHGYGDQSHAVAELRDTYTAFRAQLLAFLNLVAGRASEPFPFAQTIELMRILIAGAQSAAQNGRDIEIASVAQALDFK